MTHLSCCSLIELLERVHATGPGSRKHCNLFEVTQRSRVWYRGTRAVMISDAELHNSLLYVVQNAKFGEHFGQQKTHIDKRD